MLSKKVGFKLIALFLSHDIIRFQQTLNKRKTEKVMNAIYLIVVVLFLKLFCSFCKRNITNKKVIKSNFTTQKISTKNKWLYTTDSFGKMEKGVACDEKQLFF